VIVQLILVGAVLTLTVVSFAWFVSHTTVYTEAVNVTSEKGSELMIITQPDDYTPYKGETGQGYVDHNNPDLALDMPYRVMKPFTVVCKPNDKYTNYAFSAYLSLVNVVKSTGDIIDPTNDPLILNAFTFRLHIYDENNVEQAVYKPMPGSKFVVRESDDPEERGQYLTISEEMTLNCGFELIFLDENSYMAWLNKDYTSITEFRYCDYDFMRAVFNASFQVGMDIPG